MANLIELEEFTPGVFQIETDTIWKGGTEGAANNQGKALANRTKWLKAQLIAAQDALALKAPLNSPIFSGDPRAPTPAADDNDTSIATTAFVKTALASGFVVRDNAAAKNYTISVVSGVLALVEQA